MVSGHETILMLRFIIHFPRFNVAFLDVPYRFVIIDWRKVSIWNYQTKVRSTWATTILYHTELVSICTWKIDAPCLKKKGEKTHLNRAPGRVGGDAGKGVAAGGGAPRPGVEDGAAGAKWRRRRGGGEVEEEARAAMRGGGAEVGGRRRRGWAGGWRRWIRGGGGGRAEWGRRPGGDAGGRAEQSWGGGAAGSVDSAPSLPTS